MTESVLPSGTPRAYPSWLRGVLVASGVAHDVAIVAASLGALRFTPPSVANALVPDWLFVGMLMVGAALGLVGALRRRTVVEMVGCALMAFGMFTWAVSALTQPMTTPTSLSVGSAFLAAGLALLWRFWGVLVGVFLRARYI